MELVIIHRCFAALKKNVAHLMSNITKIEFEGDVVVLRGQTLRFYDLQIIQATVLPEIHKHGLTLRNMIEVKPRS